MFHVFLLRNALMISVVLVCFDLSYTLLPRQSSCGKQRIRPDIKGEALNRIIGGADAVKNSWPWIVSLRVYFTNTSTVSSHFCGGLL